jgi:hypothetical protein
MKRIFLKLISIKKLINTQTAKFEKQALKTNGFMSDINSIFPTKIVWFESRG